MGGGFSGSKHMESLMSSLLAKQLADIHRQATGQSNLPDVID